MMIRLTKRSPAGYRGALLACFLEEGKKKEIDDRIPGLADIVRKAEKLGDFSGGRDEKLLLYPPSDSPSTDLPAAARLLLVGLGESGKERSAERERLRQAAGTVAGEAGRLKADEVLVLLPAVSELPADEIAACVTEGLLLGNYRFTKYKSTGRKEDLPARVESFLLHGGTLSASALKRGMVRGRIGAEAACRARDMANEPGNRWRPGDFARFGRDIAAEYSLACRVLEKKDMQRLGMGGILGVNQGSAEPPKLVILEYGIDPKKPTLMLVGKGLTFDAGGISIKPAAGMEEMKYDMCGGAAVISVMRAVGEERPSGCNVVALVPATENLPGGRALKPGDIITHYGGITSEIVNTDAEGRLILADALAYGIKRYRPDAVIDLATLTGAVIIGLGHHRTGLLGNNDRLAGRLIAAGDASGEPLWRLPLGPEYTKQLKSEVADLKNVGGRPAGTITAASYLAEFVGDTPWVHLDIAGTAWNFTEKSYIAKKGPSGTGVRTLLELIRTWKPLEASGKV